LDGDGVAHPSVAAELDAWNVGFGNITAFLAHGRFFGETRLADTDGRPRATGEAGLNWIQDLRLARAYARPRPHRCGPAAAEAAPTGHAAELRARHPHTSIYFLS